MNENETLPVLRDGKPSIDSSSLSQKLSTQPTEKARQDIEHSGSLAMSSRDIEAETGKKHKHVIRDIEKMLDDLELGRPKFGRTYQNSQKKIQKEYLLPKNLTLTLVSGYSIKFRAAIVNRWQELESRTTRFNLPASYSEALRALADINEEKEALALEVKESKPKADFYDRVTAGDTVCQMAIAAQVAKLPFGRNTLFQKLREDGVMISGGNRHNLPKQCHIRSGLFTVQESSYINGKTKRNEVSFSTYVTQKGIDWLIKNYGNPSAGSKLVESGS